MQTSALVQTQEAGRTVVVFSLADKLYALPLKMVVEIKAMVTITPLPKVAPSVEGIINVRGTAVPVINLRRHLGLEVHPFGLYTPIMLTRIQGQMVGLVVDEVVEVLPIDEEAWAEMGDILPQSWGEVPLLEGLMDTDRGVVLVLNGEQLIKPAQAVPLNKALEAVSQEAVSSTPSEAVEETVEAKAVVMEEAAV